MSRSSWRIAGRVFVSLMILAVAGTVTAAKAHAFDLQVVDLTSNAAIPAFSYLINDDNANDPFHPDPARHPGVAPMASHSPIVGAGRETTASGISLPDGRYLISVRAAGYKLWGRHIRIAGGIITDADGTDLGGTVTIALRPDPLPLAKLEVLVFEDFHMPNGFPDHPYEVNACAAPAVCPNGAGGTAGQLTSGSVTNMANFHVILNDGTGQVVVDWFGRPICGTGKCLTNARGRVTIPNLPHGKFEMKVVPPTLDYIQTTTFEGTKVIDAWLEEGTDGKGAPGELLQEPGAQTAYIFGFVHKTKRNTKTSGTGTIAGTARNLVPFPPFEQLTFGEPLVSPWIVVTDVNSDTQVRVVRGAANGTFSFNMPPGLYQLMIFDEFHQYIVAFYQVQIPATGGIVSPGFDPACAGGPKSVNCRVGVFRWFGWLSGYVFLDTNRDGIKQPNEVGIRNQEVGIAFRDGSRATAAFTNSLGYYEMNQLRGPLGKMWNAEVAYGQFGITGHSKHREHFSLYNQRDPTPSVIDPGVGGGLILSLSSWEGRRSILDWGKVPYGQVTNTQGQLVYENGGISGRVLYAVTRNEYDARMAAAEDYEPGIPNVTVELYSVVTNPNGTKSPGTLLNVVQSDAWQMPRIDNPDNPVVCDVLDKDGVALPGATSQFMADHCTEVPSVGNEIHPGAYDGGWAFGDICPPATGYPCAESALIAPMPNGQYIVKVIPPPFYQILKEEDNNTTEGNELVPLLPPPPCVGAPHLVDSLAIPDFPSFPYLNQQRPLCDERLVTLQPKQNAGLDIFLFSTDNPYSPALARTAAANSWVSSQSVSPPGRFFGLVEDDINLNLNTNSITYGEKKGVPGIPIGIYESGYGKAAVGRRLITVYTDENGFYDVLLPSTVIANTPIPGGVTPGMYIIVPNDPGEPGRPNPNFSKAYIVDPVARDVWPGKMTPTDTPVDPLNALVCGVAPDAPQVFHVSSPVVNAASGGTLRITGMRFGNTGGCSGAACTSCTGCPIVTLNGIALGVVSWLPADPYVAARFEDIVEVAVPPGFAAGPAQLMVTSGPIISPPGGTPQLGGAVEGLTINKGGKESRNGLTIHVLGTGYNPPVVNVSPPAVPGTPAIQAAIDGALLDSLILIEPGTYHENVILHKRVKLQGYGPGGAVGTGNVEKTDFPCPEPNCPAVTDLGEEPFKHIPGSVIDARFFHFVGTKRAAWLATLAASGADADTSPVRAGAAITVVAGSQTEFDVTAGTQEINGARIDGLGITAGRGEAGGGIYARAFVRNLIISNNILEANYGTHGGAISAGQPTARGGLIDNQTDNLYIHHNRILDSGGIFFAGGVGIFGGADNYRFVHNDVCGCYSVEYGGGLSHWGRSPYALIQDNRFYFNDAVDEGGGILIAGDPGAGGLLGLGSGTVTIERNLIQANLSGDDGGGIRLLRPLTDRVNIINNIIVNNVAADHGGGISLDDASNVVIVNNTIADNVSTHTAEDSMLGQAHGAGITSDMHSLAFAPLPGRTAADGSRFSDPVLFNNIIFGNLAYRWGMLPGDPPDTQPRLGLVPTAFIDLEVIGGGAGDCFPNVRNNFLTGPPLSPTGAPCPLGPGNIVSAGALPPEVGTPTPRFLFPLEADRLEVAVNFGRLNPAVLVVDPLTFRKEGTLVGFTDYHLAIGLNASTAINAGVASVAAVGSQPGPITAPSTDIDLDTRPIGPQRDMGADEARIAPGAGVLETQLLEYSVGEGAGSITILITRTGGSAGTVTVDYTTGDFEAVAGLDYVRTSGTLTWVAGDAAPKSIVIPILEDTLVESPGGEEFLLVLANPTGGAVLTGGPSPVMVTTIGIVDNDVAPAAAAIAPLGGLLRRPMTTPTIQNRIR